MFILSFTYLFLLPVFIALNNYIKHCGDLKASPRAQQREVNTAWATEARSRGGEEDMVTCRIGNEIAMEIGQSFLIITFHNSRLQDQPPGTIQQSPLASVGSLTYYKSYPSVIILARPPTATPVLVYLYV